MESPLRSPQSRHSLTQTRSTKILRNFRSIFSSNTKKSKDDRAANGPYMRQTRSMDVNAPKPYMSQPMLPLSHVRSSYLDTQDGDDSSSSNDSPSDHRQPHHSLSTAFLPTTNVATAFAGRSSLDGLPRVSESRTASVVLPSGLPVTEPNPVSELLAGSSSRPSSRPSSLSGPSTPRKLVKSRGQSPARSRSSSLSRRRSKSPFRHSDILPPPPAPPPLLAREASEPSPRQAAPSGLPMPLHRFSFTMAGNRNSVRLSPAIVTRAPMPLSLPKLSIPKTAQTSSPAESPSSRTLSERRQSQIRLRAMPTLLLSPQEPPEDNDEDLEDLEEMDPDEFEDADDEFVDAPQDTTEGDYDESGMPRPSVSSDGVRPQSRASSYRQPTVPLSPLRQQNDVASPPPLRQSHSFLPLIDTSRLDLSFLDRSPTSSVTRVFDKGKAKAGDPGATPTATRRPRQHGHHQQQTTDYFSFSSESSEHKDVDGTPGTITEKTTTAMPGERARLSSVTSEMTTPRPGDAFRVPSFLRASGMGTPPTPEIPSRPSIYKHASKSMVDILSAAPRSSVDETGLRRESGLFKGKGKAKEPNESPSIDAAHVVNLNDDDDNVPLSVIHAAASTSTNDHISAPMPHSQRLSTLRRRSSMPTFNTSSEPPPYPDFALFRKWNINPEEDEGKEQLPPYSNQIYLRAIMPRKMEFAEPGVQAKDRKWRRVLCELEGTVFRVYKCPAGSVGVGALGGWWESKVGVGDVSFARNGSSTFNPSASNRGTETAPKLAAERAAGDGQTDLTLPDSTPSQLSPQPPPSSSSSSLLSPPTDGIQPTPSKSRFSSFLKPRQHSRSRSDMPNTPPRTPRSPRGSFSVPRPSFGSSSSGSPQPDSSQVISSSQSDMSLTVSVPSNMASSSSIRSSQSTTFPRTPQTSSTAKSSTTDDSGVPVPNANDLIKAYTLQHAESGLANDYIKRKNVMRVRMEGQQYLLQATDVGAVVEWIEGFQAATNVALDLDQRVMPKGPLFPRRRRRRPRPATVNGIGQITSTQNP